MKRALLTLTIFTLLFSFLCSCSKQQQQGKLKPKNISNQLYDTLKSNVQESLNAVAFLTVASGIVVGDNGTILQTTNGGYNWRPVGGLITQNLYGVSLADSLTVVAVGEKGKILRSVDRGLNWDSVLSGNTQFLKTLRGVAFYTDNDGYAVGDSGVIFLTTDKGLSWTKMHGDSSQTLNSISYNSSNIPHVTGNNGLILRSTNNGTNWSSMTLTSENLNSIHFSQINFHIHSDIGFAVGNNGTLFETVNGGQNWDSVASPSSKNLRGVFTSSPHWGYAVGDSGTVLRYNGKNWKLLPLPTIKRLNAVDPTMWNPTSICVGEDGLVLDINPPPVTDLINNKLTVNGEDPCTWNFYLRTATELVGYDENGNPVTYTRFEVCSSIEMSYFGGGSPGAGWAQNDRFFAKSVQIMPNTSYPEEQPLDPLTLISDPSVPTAGYITCYYMGNDENPYLFYSYEIGCSP
jgi:photosystem II stability/assembly factor-like uncharacterized protein